MSDTAPIPKPSHRPFLSRPQDQPSWAVGTNTYTFIVTGEHTNDSFAFFDGIIPPGGHVGAHCHGYEEMLYVLEGELTVFCADQRHALSKNTALNISSWSPHMLQNFSGVPVRLVVTTSPAELEKQFVEIGHRVPDRDSPPPEMSAQEQERIAELMPISSERHKARILPADMFDHLLTAPERSGQSER